MFQSTERKLVSLALLALACLTVADVVEDYRNGSGFLELSLDVAEVTIQLMPLLYIWYLQPLTAWHASYRFAVQAKRTRADARHWSGIARRQLDGLSLHINLQFHRWQLTPAEKDVALLLLKGFSMREIAEFRHISERTARQQATTIYAKAEVSGRAALSAFFLEDLLPSSTEASGSNTTASTQSFNLPETALK
ncbi:hypothetical protein AB838_07500 [Rhodobacteraceae bacterium (ex Bugula neritina AB1)]|nr:hypothetical protein AB838_07500 [Rhodobacteraceae bacterium (ex Bugula neritina AB1)]